VRRLRRLYPRRTQQHAQPREIYLNLSSG
jgi:hypothetical protein